MFNKSLHFLPDGFEREDYVIATYFIEDKPSTDMIKFAETLAVNMSTGTWAAVEGETEDAVINGISLEEYAKNHEELKAALDKWK